MNQLEYYQKLAVLHCVYQLIASADGGVDEERDFQAISLALNTLSCSIYNWDTALKLNPHDCFDHIQKLDDKHKKALMELFYAISTLGGNTTNRRICAESLAVLCACDHLVC